MLSTSREAGQEKFSQRNPFWKKGIRVITNDYKMAETRKFMEQWYGIECIKMVCDTVGDNLKTWIYA